MLSRTQKKLVIEELENNGYVSRNDCLKHFITRLGAIICELNKEGYDLVGKYVKTSYGKDYVYQKRFVPNNDWNDLDERLLNIKL